MDTDPDGRARPAGCLVLRLDHLRDGILVVQASGYLDHATAPDLQQVLDDQFSAAPWAVVIDLSAVSVVKPEAVPTLVQIAFRAGHADIGLCLVTADSTVTDVLATADVVDLFEIHSTCEAALEAFC